VSQQNATPVLEIRDLVVSIGEAEPLKGVQLSINPGEVHALVGESGSGKSMTALAAMRLLPKQAVIRSGQILFDGEDIVHLGAPQMRRLRGARMSMIFQEPMTSLNPVLTIGRQITETLQLHLGMNRREARARAIELLDLVGIADPGQRVDAFPHQLSGGMRQRVMIAMAVACRPRLLIADEPTTALDVTIQAQVLDLIAALQRELPMAVLLITHNIAVVGRWADRASVMYGGRVVESGPVGEVLTAPAHSYTRQLLAAVPDVKSSRFYRDGPLEEIAVPATGMPA